MPFKICTIFVVVVVILVVVCVFVFLFLCVILIVCMLDFVLLFVSWFSHPSSTQQMYVVWYQWAMYK